MAQRFDDTCVRANDAVKLGTFSDASQTWQPTSGAGQSIESNEAKLTVPSPGAYAYADAQGQVDTDSMSAEMDVRALNVLGGAFAFYIGISHPNDDSSSNAVGYDATNLFLGADSVAASLATDHIRLIYREEFDYLGVYLNGVAVLSSPAPNPVGVGLRGVQVAVVDDTAGSYVKFANFTYKDLAPRANAFKRYVKLVTDTAYAINGYGGNYTAIAELNLLLGGVPLSRSGWSVTASDEDPLNPATNVLDSDNGTYWLTQLAPELGQPHEIIIDCGATAEFDSLRVRCRNDDDLGHIGRYRVYLSDNGVTWGDAIRAGTMNSGLEPALGGVFDLYLEILAQGGKPWNYYAQAA
jgi:hypothetical protein